MAKFCMYCGNPTSEGVECNCPEAVSARQAVAGQQPAAPQTDQFYQQNPPQAPPSPYQQPMQSYAPAQGSGVQNAPPYQAPPTYYAPMQPQQSYQQGAPQQGAPYQQGYQGGYQPYQPNYQAPPPNYQAQRPRREGPNVFASAFSLFVGMFKSPADTITHAYKELGMQQGLVLCGMRAIVMGLIAALSLGLGLGGAGGFFAPFFALLIITFLSEFAFWGINILVGKIFKTGLQSKGMFAAIGASAIPLACAGVLIFLSLLINASFGMLMLVILGCYMTAVNAQTILIPHNLLPNKLIYGLAIVSAAMAVYYYLISLILGRILFDSVMSDLNSILYLFL